MLDIGWTKEELETAVRESTNYSSVLRKLNLVISGNTHNVIKKYMMKFGIDFSHFKKFKNHNFHPRWTIENALVIDSEICQPNLRRLILREKLLSYKCERCGNDGFHNGEKLSLQLDHENGIRTDNRLENLRWLCPNCHSQTPTYSRSRTPQTREVERERRAEYVDLICAQCEKNFKRLKSRVNYGKNAGVEHVFCSNNCKSKYWRQSHGNYKEGPHGTLSGYFHCPKPRCRPCLDAMKNYKRDRRNKKHQDAKCNL